MHELVPSVQPLAGSRVLLAEDDPHLRRLIALHLHRDGHDVVEARDGNEAGALIELSASAGEPFSAIVMDVRMPGRGGLAILHALADTDSSIPVVLITAFGDEEVHRRAAELGAKAVLDKPFAMEVLRRLVTDTISPEQARELSRQRSWANDRVLVDRYLDLVNRALAEQSQRRRASSTGVRVDGPVEVRVVEPGPGGTNSFVLEWQSFGGYQISPRCTEPAAISYEVTRAHLEAAIAMPWQYLAHPEQLILV